VEQDSLRFAVDFRDQQEVGLGHRNIAIKVSVQHIRLHPRGRGIEDEFEVETILTHDNRGSAMRWCMVPMAVGRGAITLRWVVFTAIQ